MKLHRFIADNIQKAMNKIQESLGSDALIYSTRTVNEGVEILASSSNVDVQHSDHEDDKQGAIEVLNSKLQTIDGNLQRLSQYISARSVYDFHLIDDEKSIKKNLLYYHLNKLGFRGRFCNKFVSQYLKSEKLADHINEDNIKKSLVNYIKFTESEFINERNICALIGPTGVGKTTTIAKLAKRYISRYGESSLGFITTDYSDLVGKNQLVYYSKLFNVDLEYVNDIQDLDMVLGYMKKKKMILIDTHGVSQRDCTNVSLLLDLLESQGDKISSYVTLPCNVQEPILDEIARAFSSTTLRGCILTKQDESISLAPVLSVSMNYKLKIAYICNGQDVNNDIECVNPDKILHHIMNESTDMKHFTEENLFKNISRVKNYLHNHSEKRLAFNTEG
jgi:flagellar biosynthesis protein FlhF